jgi:dipeptidase E
MPSAPFVDDARRKLQAAGLEVTTLDLDRADADDVRSVLDGGHVVFVTGGYALYLLQHVRRTGFDTESTRRVEAGELAYVGISAGAALAGPDLRPLQDPDDPGRVDSADGLGLVPFVVLAHRDRGRGERHDQLAAAYAGQLALISITDTEAVSIENGHWAIYPSP